MSIGAYAPSVVRMASLLVHRYRSDDANTPVNAYLIEGSDGIVGVDATLTVSGGRGLRARAEALGKPLLGVVVTHAHPDHYGGLVELVAGRDVPVFATKRVHDVIRRDDPVKEQILRPMFGDQWPAAARFPDRRRRRRGDDRTRGHRLDRHRPRPVRVTRRLDLDADAASPGASSPPTSPTTERTATSPTGSMSPGSPAFTGSATSSRRPRHCTLATGSRQGWRSSTGRSATSRRCSKPSATPTGTIRPRHKQA